MPNSQCNEHLALGRQFGNTRPKMRPERGKGHFQPGIDDTSWTLDYSYDAQNQLTDDTNNTYDYDAGGNRDTGYTYNRNAANTHDTDQLASDGVWDYGYDADGNIIEKDFIGTSEHWTYGYDNANHLIEAKHYNTSGTLDDVADYSYDVFGNRVQKVVDDDRVSPSSPVTQRYAIDGWNPAKPTPVGNENFDVLADLNGSSSLTTRYFRGDRVAELSGRVETAGSPASYWHLTDQLGFARDILDGDGDVVESLRYDSFGNIDTGTELDPDYRGRYGWTGRRDDVETGLQYTIVRGIMMRRRDGGSARIRWDSMRAIRICIVMCRMLHPSMSIRQDCLRECL